MKVKTTEDEDRFVTLGAKDYYQAATAVHAFQNAVLRTLREVTDEFDSQLNGLGLSFSNPREDKNLVSPPWIGRRITSNHVGAGIYAQWFSESAEHKGKSLCIYWWIWLKDRDNRESLGKFMRKATRKPCEWGGEGRFELRHLLLPPYAIGTH